MATDVTADAAKATDADENTARYMGADMEVDAATG